MLLSNRSMLSRVACILPSTLPVAASLPSRASSRASSRRLKDLRQDILASGWHAAALQRRRMQRDFGNDAACLQTPAGGQYTSIGGVHALSSNLAGRQVRLAHLSSACRLSLTSSLKSASLSSTSFVTFLAINLRRR